MSRIWEVLKNSYETEDKQAVILICGKEYRAHRSDRFIYDTLEMVDRCKKEVDFFTYEKIVLLRCWVRENYQHDLQVPTGARTVAGLRKFLRACVEAENRADGPDPEWNKYLKEKRTSDLEHISKF